MLKTLFLKIFLIFLVVSTIFISEAYASDNICSLSLTPSNEYLHAGDEFNIILSVNDISIDTGIAALDGILEYNQDIFEQISFQPSTNWNKNDIINNHISIMTSSLEANNNSQNIFKVTFKVKDSATEGTYDIKFNKIDISDNNANTYEISNDVLSTITVIDPSDNTEQYNNSNNEYMNSINSNTLNTKNKENLASSKLPFAGIIRFNFILISVIIIIGIIYYLKYRSKKK